MALPVINSFSSIPGTLASNEDTNVTYNSYAGVDMVAQIITPTDPPIIIGELQTVSYSMHRENVPVRTLGHVSPVGFVKGPRCLPATEKVLIKDKGYISIADVKPYDYVQSDLDNYNMVLGSYYQGMKFCYKLETEDGYNLTASFDHPIATIRGWINMEDLQINNDKVLISAVAPTPEEDYPIDDDILMMVAFLIGDGSTHIYKHKDSDSKWHRISLAINAEEMHFIGIESERIIRNLGLTFKDQPNETGTLINRNISICTDGNGQTDWRLRKYGRLHSALLEYDLYDRYSHTKIIPQEFIAHLSKRQIAIFLRYLFATDGGYSIAKSLIEIEASYCSTSEELIDGIRILLSKLGVSSLKHYESKIGKIGGHPSIISNYDSYKLVISNSINLLRFIRRIGILGKDNRIMPYIDLLRERMCNDALPMSARDYFKKAQEIITQKGLKIKDFKYSYNIYNYNLKRMTPKKAIRLARAIGDQAFITFTNNLIDQLLDSNYEYLERKITSINSVGFLPVYDLEVEDRHSFIANHIKVHNTIAGSLIFTVFDSYFFYKLPSYQQALAQSIFPVADMMPPFDIVISMQNEYGSASKMRIFGVTIVDEGAALSIDDLITEQTYSYMARGVQPIITEAQDLSRFNGLFATAQNQVQLQSAPNA